MEISHQIVKEFLEKRQKLSKHVRYEYQQFGLFLAYKLNEWDKRSFYIRIARDEPRQLVQQAFTYALYSPEGKRAKTFLWRLTELKQKTYYRAFVGVFFHLDENKQLLTLWNALNSKLSTYDSGFCRLERYDKLHITLYFFPRLKAIYYVRLVRLVRRLREKYGEMVKIGFDDFGQWGGQSPLGLKKANSMAFRLHRGLAKLARAYSRSLVQLLGSDKTNKFFPHVTLIRLSRTKEAGHKPCINAMVNTGTQYVPIELQGRVYLAISRLTSKGSKYTIHVDSKV